MRTKVRPFVQQFTERSQNAIELNHPLTSMRKRSPFEDRSFPGRLRQSADSILIAIVLLKLIESLPCTARQKKGGMIVKKRTVAIVFALVLCVGVSISVVLTKTGDSSKATDHTSVLIDAAHPVPRIDADAGLGPEALGYLEPVGDDRWVDTTYTDPNFDPRSWLDAEILDALRDADPETPIVYDPVTGTITIPDQAAPPSESIAETPPYALDDAAAVPTAPVDISETFADTGGPS